MGLKQWLGLNPTPAEFAALMIQGARQLGLGTFEYDPGMNELRQTDSDNKVQLYLGRVHQEYIDTPRRDRAGVVERFLSSVLAHVSTIPDTYAQARPHLLPLVRDRTDVAIAELYARRAAVMHGSGVQTAMAGKPLVGTLIQGIAYDTPHAMHRVSLSHLDTWGVSLETVLSDAIDNLRELTHPNGWTQLDAQTWSGHWGDAYASSRMLTPEVIHQLGMGDPIAIIPTPDSLIVTSGRRESGLATLAHWAEQAQAPGRRSLSFVPYRLEERSWFEIPETGAYPDALRNLQLMSRAGAYREQKEQLDDLHRRTDRDIWVAGYDLVQKRGSDRMSSYTVWTESVDTMLPLADLVFLQALSPDMKEVIRRLAVPMDAALPILVRHLEPCLHLFPVRYRTKGFPTSDDWRELEAMATQP